MRSRFLVSVVALFAFAVPGYAYRMSAWVPSWDPSAVTVMQMQAGNLEETNPGWYTIAADGSVTNNYKAEDPAMRAALSGTMLVPTIKNYIGGRFDGALVAAIVNDPVRREAHAETLTRLVIERGLDGIDVDYEGVPTTANASFTAFVQLLAAKLHEANRILSVTVHAKTSEKTNWNGPGAQDWAAIGAVADSVKIMGYDKHYDGGAAGAIAPLDWLGQVAAYAQTTIPAGKAILGLPWYGYDWLGTDGTTVTYASATAIAQTAGATITRDVNGEATFTYSGRTVFFQDLTAYKTKIDFITKNYPGIAGFAAWRVGAEDPAIWTVVRELTMQAEGTAPIQGPPMDFAVSGPAEISVVAGGAASAQYSYTGINGFDLNVAASVRIVDDFGGYAALTATTVTNKTSTLLLVSVPKTTRPGSYRISVKMSGARIDRTEIVTLKVSAPASKSAKRRSA
jgi:spore germination protein